MDNNNKNSHLYNEAFTSALVHEILEEELRVFKNYEKIIKDKQCFISIYLKDVIGTIELRMALAKAIISKNNEIIQERL